MRRAGRGHRRYRGGGVVIDITATQLRDCLRYEPETGFFFWLIDCRRARKGNRAGSTDKDGRVCIGINGQQYRAHRLAWLYMTGEWPSMIDHRNGNPSDNSWSNLRLANWSQNMRNRRVLRNNETGVKGIRRIESGRWMARIMANGESYYLGLYDDMTSARKVYAEAAARLHGDFARL